MSLVTLTLEVRTDFDDPEKQQALREVVRETARNIIATAALLQERQVPIISLYECDYDEGGTEAIDLYEDKPND